MEYIFGYIGALLMGVVLGLIGGGGSILTVPVLVYLIHLNPITATAYSLFVVGSAALVGAIRNIPERNIDFRTGIIFAIPALVAVYSTRKFLIPALPDIIFSIGNFDCTKEIAIMVFFAIIMMVAALSMIKSKQAKTINEEGPVIYNYPMIVIEGFVVGVLTGVVGAGGGFLIIPALVLFAKLPMKKAVGTSLFIISIKSLIGFLGDVGNVSIDWFFLLSFTGFAIVGILLGVYLTRFIEGKKLKKAFGFFVLIMATYILLKELI